MISDKISGDFNEFIYYENMIISGCPNRLCEIEHVADVVGAAGRLFSYAGLIATSQRNGLSDSVFEKVLMMKANQNEYQ